MQLAFGVVEFGADIVLNNSFFCYLLREKTENGHRLIIPLIFRICN